MNKDFKKKGEIPWGVKCMVYGCGFEWYKGSPMTNQELKEHRCIHFNNPTPDIIKKTMKTKNKPKEHCQICKDWEKPTWRTKQLRDVRKSAQNLTSSKRCKEPLGDKRGWVNQATTIIVPKGMNKERLTPKMEREIYWKIRYEELKSNVAKLVAKTKKDMVEEIKKEWVEKDSPLTPYGIKLWSKLKKRLLK